MHWDYCKIADFTEEQLQRAYGQLTPSRKARIDSLRRREDRNRSLAAELLVYRLLQQYWNITEVKLQSTSDGKPYLEDCPLQVSISHCNDVVACAISRDPVGIDVEYIRPINLKVCNHICVPEEVAYISAGEQDFTDPCTDPAVLRRFYEVWTAKEAYFKKLGTGMVNPKSANILPLQRQVCVTEGYFIQII